MLAISSMYDNLKSFDSYTCTDYGDYDNYSDSGDSTDTIKNEFTEEEIPIICNNIKIYLKENNLSDDLEDGIWLNDEDIILFQKMYHNKNKYIVYFTRCDVNKNLYIGIFDKITKNIE